MKKCGNWPYFPRIHICLCSIRPRILNWFTWNFSPAAKILRNDQIMPDVCVSLTVRVYFLLISNEIYYHLFECFSNLTANLENNTVAPKTRYSSVYRADVLYYSGTVRRRNELLSERSLTKIIYYIHKRNIHAGRPPDYYSGK